MFGAVGDFQAGDAGRGVTGLEALVEIALQNWPRADLDEELGAGLAGRGNGGGKLHGIAHVAPPVAGSECRPGQRRARYRGDERFPAGLGPQCLECGGQGTCRRRQQAAVERIVEIEHFAAHPLTRGERSVGGDGRLSAHHCDRAWAIDGGNFQVGDAAFGDALAGGLLTQPQCGHGAASPGGFLVPRPGEDDVDGGCKRERTRHLSGRHLANAVSKHGVRF